MSDLLRSVAVGKLDISGREIECHVLSNGMRVLDTTQAQAFFGAAKDRMFRRMVAKIHGLSKELALQPRIAFTLPGGGIAYGYEAKFISRICVAYQMAYLASKLHPKQIPIALEAMAFVGAWADLGLEALIDAVTGYQSTDRQSNFDRYFREHKQEWQERWTGGVVRAFCLLYRKPYPLSSYPKFMQSIAGRVYDMVIGSATMAELRRKNPEPSKGRNHHQFFTEKVQVYLEKELDTIQALVETSPSRSWFWKAMGTRYRGDDVQTVFEWRSARSTPRRVRARKGPRGRPRH